MIPTNKGSQSWIANTLIIVPSRSWCSPCTLCRTPVAERQTFLVKYREKSSWMIEYDYGKCDGERLRPRREKR